MEKQEETKVGKQFDETLSKLSSLLSGKLLSGKEKMGKDDISLAVEELAKEEKEEIVKEFKQKAIELIKAKREFDSFVKQQEAELKKKKEEKQKAFTADATKLFSLMEKAEKIEVSYANTLGAAEKGEELAD